MQDIELDQKTINQLRYAAKIAAEAAKLTPDFREIKNKIENKKKKKQEEKMKKKMQRKAA